ncbi:S-layer homology domain-containing protein [Candidatus Pacearchaeota archaeon]|nr:S-layer homology domain-containing protein [Candidatus Pacearchaeota archaeon]
MKKRMLVFVFILVSVLLISSVLAFSWSDIWGIFKVKTTGKVVVTSSTCTDSDGLDYNVLGKVTLQNIEKYWAYDSIEAIYRAGITIGCMTNPLRYCPDSYTTRAEMALFLVRALAASGKEITMQHPGSYYFTDVQAGSNYDEAVGKIRELGITLGCTTTTYCPNNYATRAQVALFLVRTLNALYGKTLTALHNGSYYFTDVPAGSAYDEAVGILKERGITQGCTTTTYCPTNNATRAEVAVFIQRAFAIVIYENPTPSFSDVPRKVISTTEKSDYCTNLQTLIEYYCSNNNMSSVEYNCPYGCSNGACSKQECVFDSDCPRLVCIRAPCPYYKCIDGKCVMQQTYNCNENSLVGDINSDGKVTVDDANITSSIALGTIPMPTNICCIDVNKDGKVDVLDVVKITRIAQGLDPSPGTCAYVSLTCNDFCKSKGYSSGDRVAIISQDVLNKIQSIEGQTVSVELSEGEIRTVILNSVSYSIAINSISTASGSNVAYVSVNGGTSARIAEGNTSIIGGLEIYAQRVDYLAKTGTVSSAILNIRSAAFKKVVRTEGETVTLNSYFLINSPTNVRLLQLTDFYTAGTPADYIVFVDALTGETFKVSTGSSDSGQLSVDGQIYYVVNITSPTPIEPYRPGMTITVGFSLTWGKGATYNNAGTEKTIFDTDSKQACNCLGGTTVTCTDSDGGLNYFVKGEVINVDKKYIDSCFSDSKYPNGLTEYYCSDAPNYQPLSILFNCPNGCQDGACINQTCAGHSIKIIGATNMSGKLIVSTQSYGVAENVDVYLIVNSTYVMLSETKCPSISGACGAGPSGPVSCTLYTNCSYPSFQLGYRHFVKVVDKVCPSVSAIYEIQTNVTCTDSDGGINYYVKGTAKNSSTTDERYTDYCLVAGGTFRYVNEYYCGSSGLILSTTKECPNGCSDGACVDLNEICSDSEIAGKISIGIDSYGLNKRVTFTSALADSVYTFSFAHRDGSHFRLADASNKTIHALEAEELFLNEYQIVDSGNYGRILQLTDYSCTESISDYITFIDAITNEQFKVVTGTSCRGKLNLDGQTYYVSNMSSYRGTYFVITWGNGSNYASAGSQQTMMPKIQLKSPDLTRPDWISIGTEDWAERVYGYKTNGSDYYLGDPVVMLISSINTSRACLVPEVTGGAGGGGGGGAIPIPSPGIPGSGGGGGGSVPTPSPTCVSGCVKDTLCLPFGTRVKGQYCEIDSQLKQQKAADVSCENNYECSTNVCIDGKCISQGLWQAFLSWFKNFFGV